jgi:hypothetical protein
MKRTILFLCVLCGSAVLLVWAATEYSQPFASGHSWTYTQTGCAGTCATGDVSTDGNPLPSVQANIIGRNKAMTGYWKKAYTWEALGVPAGDTIQTVDGNWDNKIIGTLQPCKSPTYAGMAIYDSANTTACTASAVEPDMDISGDTDSVWTNHNPTGAVNVNSGCQASSTTVTLRATSSPYSGNDTNAKCEMRLDNYKLTIVSEATAQKRRSQTIVVWNRGHIVMRTSREITQ